MSGGVRGLLVGRFQPFHAGHLAVVRAIRAARPGDELILGVGSAQESHTWKNPFTAGERLEMIHRALAEGSISAVIAIPIPDIHRHALWVRYVESLLPPFERIYTNNPLTRLLFEAARYPVEAPAEVDRARFEGESIRRRIADGDPWHDRVPPSVARYLEELHASDRLRLLRAGDGGPSGSRPG
ncbi:MAG TPA: nicotinamide-nucleotide adenylyltransferase [Thermoplasmata archaeon]|nr:nicotinamide-nucleotide adenylyltransferase [Thermoplasmata archaeon]